MNNYVYSFQVKNINDHIVIKLSDEIDDYYYKFAIDGDVSTDGWYYSDNEPVIGDELDKLLSNNHIFADSYIFDNISSINEIAPFITELVTTKASEWQDYIPVDGNVGDVLTKVNGGVKQYINGNLPSVNTEVTALYVGAINLVDNLAGLSYEDWYAPLFKLSYDDSDYDEILDIFTKAFGAFTDARIYEEEYAGIYLTSYNENTGFIVNTADHDIVIDWWDGVVAEAKTAYWVMYSEITDWEYVLYKFPDNEDLIAWFQDTFGVTFTKPIYLKSIDADEYIVKKFISINTPYEVEHSVIIDWQAPSGGADFPEGGNNGDVLTRVITPEIPGKKTLKDSYTYEELEAFYGNLEIGAFKGVNRDGYYTFDVYRNTNDNDSKYYEISYFLYDIGKFMVYKCNFEGYEDGWYEEEDKLDYAPEFFMPDDLTEEDFEYISDVSEMNILLNIIEPQPAIATVEWKSSQVDDCLDPLSDHALSNKAITEQLDVLTRDLLAGVGQGSGGTSGAIQYLTEEPTEDNLDGLKIVILNYEPEIMYKGYMYITLDEQE